MPTTRNPAIDATAGRSATSALDARSQTRPSPSDSGVEASARAEKTSSRLSTVTTEITPAAASTETAPRAIRKKRSPRVAS